MNLAISAVIFIILLLPPVIFYISFSYGRFQKGKPALSLLEMLMASAVFAMLVHIIGLFFLYQPVRFDVLLLLLSGDIASAIEKCSNEEFRVYLIKFSLYSTIQLLIAGIMGKLFRWYLNHFEIHSKIEMFRIYNHWWYLFNAYKSSNSHNQKIRKNFDLVVIDVLTNTSSGAMLYSGLLTDFICNGETLEWLYISEAAKREFKTIHPTDKGHFLINKPGVAHQVKSDTLAIPGKEIININVNFIIWDHG